MKTHTKYIDKISNKSSEMTDAANPGILRFSENIIPPHMMRIHGRVYKTRNEMIVHLDKANGVPLNTVSTFVNKMPTNNMALSTFKNKETGNRTKRL
mmetsp:Transcript_12638/g.20109  ORF Transcript_12638/g.20109 Transcript_12638/m.20109 type:complete len:97 (-) Transcript_12638:280-570(-)